MLSAKSGTQIKLQLDSPPVFWRVIALAVLFTIGWSSVEARTDAAVPFVAYDGYFVSNQFEPNAADSFVVLQNQASFDRVFGVATVMDDHSHRLEPNVFGSRMVVAAIHRGHADIRYRIVRVTRDGTLLRINYTTTAHPTPLTEYACPLILSVPRDNYSTVAFVENGKLVKKLPTVDH